MSVNKPFNIFTIIRVLTFICTLCRADEDKVPRIVDGTEAVKGRYPYLVQLGESSLCGGSLIAPKYILSAAHCKGMTEAYIGVHNISETYLTVKIEREIVHPNYNTVTDENDVMIIELSSEVSSEYPPVVLDENTQNLKTGDPVNVMGWGALYSDGPSSDVLLETEVNIFSDSECESVYSDFDGRIFEGTLCAYREGTDSCQGDSGGPLIVKGDSSSNDVQVGIVSWGNGCAEKGFPGVYARVSYYIDWIKSNAGLDTSPTPPSPTPPSLLCRGNKKLISKMIELIIP